MIWKSQKMVQRGQKMVRKSQKMGWKSGSMMVDSTIASSYLKSRMIVAVPNSDIERQGDSSFKPEHF